MFLAKLLSLLKFSSRFAGDEIPLRWPPPPFQNSSHRCISSYNLVRQSQKQLPSLQKSPSSVLSASWARWALGSGPINEGFVISATNGTKEQALSLFYQSFFFNSTIIKEYFNDIYLRFTSYVYRNSINYCVWLDANLKISNSKIKYFFEESNPWVKSGPPDRLT